MLLSPAGLIQKKGDNRVWKLMTGATRITSYRLILKNRIWAARLPIAKIQDFEQKFRLDTKTGARYWTPVDGIILKMAGGFPDPLHMAIRQIITTLSIVGAAFGLKKRIFVISFLTIMPLLGYLNCVLSHHNENRNRISEFAAYQSSIGYWIQPKNVPDFDLKKGL